MKLLTEDVLEEGWSGAGRQVEANKVDWYTRQRHSNAHQRVDGVAVEGNHDQEYAAHTVDDREEQRQLQGRVDDKGKVRKREKCERLGRKKKDSNNYIKYY